MRTRYPSDLSLFATVRSGHVLRLRIRLMFHERCDAYPLAAYDALRLRFFDFRNVVSDELELVPWDPLDRLLVPQARSRTGAERP